MKKVIHLSDLHVGCNDCGQRFQGIVNAIVFEKEPAKNYVIVITGDLVEKATDRSNYAETQMYLEKLREAGFTVLVTPGNHDYGTGAWGSKQYVQGFKDAFFTNPNVTYPKLDVLEGVAFIALDSMAEELHWYDRMFAQGELGKPQLKRLADMLSSAEVKRCKYRVIYMHHHPFDRLPLHELKDSENLGEVLMDYALDPNNRKAKRRIDAMLYGHNHAGKKHNGKWGIPRCYDGGTATGKDGDVACHRVIDLSREAGLDYDGDFHCD